MRNSGWFSDHFRACYLRSLGDYRLFYDDVEEVGRAEDAEYVFYFVPGISGTPGQMRVLLPGLTKVFGPKIFLKSLHLPEFSARQPVWNKYSSDHVARKLARLREDLTALLARHARITVMCSSNGFYDFAAAVNDWPREQLAGRIQLIWGACAPDHFNISPWEKFFHRINGFTHEGHRWFAFPNHNALKFANPETSHSMRWRDGHQRGSFRKSDLEMRFRCWGLDWAYVSTGQLGKAVQQVVRGITHPVELPAEALVAAHDGYWEGKPRAQVDKKILSYLPNALITYKPTSHLWVVAHPGYITELFERVKLRLIVSG